MGGLTIHWASVPFAALDVPLLHDILRLRTDVFVVEQQCAYAEVDGADPTAHHIIGRTEDGRTVAYARVLPPGVDGLPHIGRVVVHPDHRGQGLARTCVSEALRTVRTVHGDTPCALSAQAHLLAFYGSFGFRPTGPEYLLDGIPHVDMRN